MLRALDDRLTADPGFQRDYPAEAAALAALAEPRVATAHRYIASAGGAVVAVIRRKLDGAPLSEVLARLPHGLDSQTAATVVRDVLVALDALHGRGVAHRSVHPDRVVVEPDGTCVLVDAALAPRAVDDDPAAAMAADVAAIPDLYALCASAWQPETKPRTLREQAEAARLEGMRGVLHAALVAARDAGQSTDADQGTGVRSVEPDGAPDAAVAGAAETGTGTGAAEAGAPGAASPAALTAAEMLGALHAVVADSFDSGWDGLGRAQLAAAVAAHRQPQLRVIDFLPPHRLPKLSVGRGTHAGARRDNRELLDATGRVLRQMWKQLAELWLGRRARERDSGRASHALRPPTTPSFTRYAAPLIAFLLTFGLVVIVLSAARSSSVQAISTPSRAPTTAAARAQPSGVASPSSGGAVTTPAGATSSATNVARGENPPPKGATAPAEVSSARAVAPTTVTSLTVSGLGYDGHGNQVQAVVNVKTSGTASVTVVVVFEPPDGWNTIPGGTKTHRYTLSGHTQYTITANVHIPHYCSFFEQYTVAYVHVTATVPPSHGAQASATRELLSDYC